MKAIEKLTWDELVDYLTAYQAEQFAKGEKWRSIIFAITDMSVYWSKHQKEME